MDQAIFHTPAWKQVEEWAEQQLQQAREKNDGNHDPVKTASIRGEIGLLKRLLDLPNVGARAVHADLTD